MSTDTFEKEYERDPSAEADRARLLLIFLLGDVAYKKLQLLLDSLRYTNLSFKERFNKASKIFAEPVAPFDVTDEISKVIDSNYKTIPNKKDQRSKALFVLIHKMHELKMDGAVEAILKAINDENEKHLSKHGFSLSNDAKLDLFIHHLKIDFKTLLAGHYDKNIEPGKLKEFKVAINHFLEATGREDQKFIVRVKKARYRYNHIGEALDNEVESDPKKRTVYDCIKNKMERSPYLVIDQEEVDSLQAQLEYLQSLPDLDKTRAERAKLRGTIEAYKILQDYLKDDENHSKAKKKARIRIIKKILDALAAFTSWIVGIGEGLVAGSCILPLIPILSPILSPLGSTIFCIALAAAVAYGGYRINKFLFTPFCKKMFRSIFLGRIFRDDDYRPFNWLDTAVLGTFTAICYGGVWPALGILSGFAAHSVLLLIGTALTLGVVLALAALGVACPPAALAVVAAAIGIAAIVGGVIIGVTSGFVLATAFAYSGKKILDIGIKNIFLGTIKYFIDNYRIDNWRKPGLEWIPHLAWCAVNTAGLVFFSGIAIAATVLTAIFYRSHTFTVLNGSFHINAVASAWIANVSIYGLSSAANSIFNILSALGMHHLLSDASIHIANGLANGARSTVAVLRAPKQSLSEALHYVRDKVSDHKDYVVNKLITIKDHVRNHPIDSAKKVFFAPLNAVRFLWNYEGEPRAYMDTAFNTLGQATGNSMAAAATLTSIPGAVITPVAFAIGGDNSANANVVGINEKFKPTTNPFSELKKPADSASLEEKKQYREGVFKRFDKFEKVRTTELRNKAREYFVGEKYKDFRDKWNGLEGGSAVFFQEKNYRHRNVQLMAHCIGEARKQCMSATKDPNFFGTEQNGKKPFSKKERAVELYETYMSEKCLRNGIETTRGSGEVSKEGISAKYTITAYTITA